MRNRLIAIVAIFLITGFLVSCVSLEDRPLSFAERNETEVIGTVQVEFASFQWFHFQNRDRIRSNAYDRLLESARNQYGNNVDIRNIVMTGRALGGRGHGLSDVSSFPGVFAWEMLHGVAVGMPLGLILGDFSIAQIDGVHMFEPTTRGALAGTAIGLALIGHNQIITATGDVISLSPTGVQGRRPISRVATTGVEGAIHRASNDLMEELPDNSRIAVINVSSNDMGLSALAVDELEFYLVTARRFTVVDRLTLDAIRAEQDFQLAGEVSDASAISIGQLLGASIVITGNIIEIGASQRLSFRALDVRTGQIITMVRETF